MLNLKLKQSLLIKKLATSRLKNTMENLKHLAMKIIHNLALIIHNS